MDGLFQLLGVAVGCYVAYGLATGEVYAKSGVFGRRFRRDHEGLGYWSAIGAYTLLCAALLFWF
jgi:hypothetical protein